MSEFIREQNIRQLGTGIRREPKIRPFKIQVVEVELSVLMGIGCDIDNAGLALQMVKQKIGQQEGREMVHEKSFFDPTAHSLTPVEVGSGIVDEHIQFWELGFDLLCQMTDLSQVRKIC